MAQAATESASEAAARAAQAAAIAAAFPSLPGAQLGGGGALNLDELAEAAFSDEEGTLLAREVNTAGEAQQQPGARMPRVDAPANSFSSDGMASALAGARWRH